MSKSINIIDKNNLPEEIVPKASNFKNIKGEKFGRLTALYPCGYLGKEKRLAWVCKCECGNYIMVPGKSLRNGNTKSCGCLQRDITVVNNKKRGKEIRVGDVFGKLTVTKNLGLFEKNGKRANKYLCDCSCGTKNIEVWGVYLNTGEKKSCGCLRSVGEMTIKQYLDEHNIKYNTQLAFIDLVSDNNVPLKFDFAFINKNEELSLIEYQGDIHFKSRETGWNDEERFQLRQKYDERKRQYCYDNCIPLYEITYLDNTIEKLEEILKKEGII